MKRIRNSLRNRTTRWLPEVVTSLWWLPFDLARGLTLALTIFIALISRDNS